MHYSRILISPVKGEVVRPQTIRTRGIKIEDTVFPLCACVYAWDPLAALLSRIGPGGFRQTRARFASV